MNKIIKVTIVVAVIIFLIGSVCNVNAKRDCRALVQKSNELNAEAIKVRKIYFKEITPSLSKFLPADIESYRSVEYLCQIEVRNTTHDIWIGRKNSSKAILFINSRGEN